MLMYCIVLWSNTSITDHLDSVSFFVAKTHFYALVFKYVFLVQFDHEESENGAGVKEPSLSNNKANLGAISLSN